MAGYTTPAWANNAAPAIDATALTNMGHGIEIAEHPFGVCNTGANDAAKTVTVDFSGTLTLFTGLTIQVMFAYPCYAADPTLNVNGTGAFPIILTNDKPAAYLQWLAKEMLTLVYDGTNWVISSGSSGSVRTARVLGNFASISEVETLLDDLDTTLPSNTSCMFRISCTANAYPFQNGYGYFGTFYSVSGGYSLAIINSVGYGRNIFARKNGTAWQFDWYAPVSMLPTYDTLLTTNVQATAANTWMYAGTSFTIPSGSVGVVKVSTAWNSGRPIGLGINTSDSISTTYKNPAYYFIDTRTDAAVLNSPTWVLTAGTYYPFHMRANTGSSNNTLTVNGVMITV